MQQIRPRNIFLQIKYQLLEWEWDKLLKKSNCYNWHEYFRRNDSRYNPDGATIEEKLCGYPYVTIVDKKNYVQAFDPIWGVFETWENVNVWCQEHCRGKFRDEWTSSSVNTCDDLLYYGFTDERDCVLFMLRWS